MIKVIGPAEPVYVPDGIGVGGGGVILGKGPAEPVYLVDATGQIFDVSGLYSEVQKIDSAPVDGLSGVHDSLGYLAAGTYSDKVFMPQSVAGRPSPVPFGIKRRTVGTKVWMRTLVRGQDTGTIGVYIEIHEYEG